MKIYNQPVLWLGTAEVNHTPKGEACNASRRCEAALVSTPGGRHEKVMVKWDGTWIPENQVEFSREYEDQTGKLVAGEIAAKLEAALTRRH